MQGAATPGIQRFCCRIPKGSFNNGVYTVDVGISKNYTEWLCHISEALKFEVENAVSGIGVPTSWPGVFRPQCQWQIR
jgi:hypothetical protein